MLHDQEFCTALEQAIALATRLEHHLLEETSTLEGRDPAQLEALIEHKRQVIEQLETQTARLKRSVEKAGHQFTVAGLADFLPSLAPAPDAPGTPTERWQQLREITARCELMNRENAKSIERHRKRVTTALNLIRGEDGSSATYSAKGDTQSTTVLGRTLTHA
jgi:flagella synthesis protein FlgN